MQKKQSENNPERETEEEAAKMAERFFNIFVSENVKEKTFPSEI